MKRSASEPGLTRRRITFFSSVIKDWNVNSAISHLAGGMKYKDGKLTVPSSGRYYIYAQIYYHNNGRVHVRVNNAVITMVTPPIGGGQMTGAMYAGAVYNLQAGDVITLDAARYPSSGAKVYMYSMHTYFGAFLL